MSADDNDHETKPPPSDDEGDPIARRLSDVFGESDEDDDASSGPRLRLDKTGALADRPKLKPKRPYARTGRDVPDVAGSEEGQGAGAQPRKATIPPPLGAFVPPELQRESGQPPDDEVTIPSGSFLFGEERETRDLSVFRIDRAPVTNRQYGAFVQATGHRPPLYWPDAKPPEELSDHPVVGVDYYDALAYAQWKGKDLPYEDEWERAARGTDGRTYPWGDEPELGEANTARIGVRMTLPIGWHAKNVSPDGVRDLVGNVWEITHSPAPGGGIVVRGGSWYDFALYAKNWFRFASRPDARNGTIGFRCVRRERERRGPPREIDAASAEAEIRARRGPEGAMDVSAFAPERRDLVPDYRRLRQILSDREAEEAEAAGRPLTPVTSSHVGRRTRTPTKAAPPPPLTRTPRPPAVKKAAPAPKPPEPASSEKKAPEKRVPEKRVPVERVPAKKAPESEPAAPPPPEKAAPETPPAPVSQAGPPATPLLYWGFLGGALLLVTVFLVLLLSGVIGRRDVPPTTDGDPTVAGDPRPGPGGVIPPPIPDGLPIAEADDPRDDDPPTFVGGVRGGLPAGLAEGARLLVFVRGHDEAARQSIRAANDVHRQLRDTDVQIVVVTPLALFDGLGESERLARLRDLGATSDVTVLLDPDVGPPFGSALRTYFRVPTSIAVAALLLVDGEPMQQFVPREERLTLERLRPLARRALEITDER